MNHGRTHGQRHGRTTRKHIASAAGAAVRRRRLKNWHKRSPGTISREPIFRYKGQRSRTSDVKKLDRNLASCLLTGGGSRLRRRLQARPNLIYGIFSCSKMGKVGLCVYLVWSKSIQRKFSISHGPLPPIHVLASTHSKPVSHAFLVFFLPRDTLYALSGIATVTRSSVRL